MLMEQGIVDYYDSWWVFNEILISRSRLFHKCGAAIDRLFHKCGAAIDRLFHKCGAAIDRLFHKCGAAIDRLFHKCGAAIDRVFQMWGAAVERHGHPKVIWNRKSEISATSLVGGKIVRDIGEITRK